MSELPPPRPYLLSYRVAWRRERWRQPRYMPIGTLDGARHMAHHMATHEPSEDGPVVEVWIEARHVERWWTLETPS